MVRLEPAGDLRTTLNKAEPAAGDGFGIRVAALGSEGVIIGTPYDDTGATNAGSVYLFSVPSQAIEPSLTIQLASSNTAAVSWTSPSTRFVLQQDTNGLSSINWSSVGGTIQDDGTNKTLTVSPTNQSRFYRLVHH